MSNKNIIQNNSNSRRSFFSKLSHVIVGSALMGSFASLFAQSKPKSMAEITGGYESFIGSIHMVGFNFAPTGWAFCNGQFLPIAENTALYSLIGTTYGGDGVSKFALPDFRGKVPVGMGQGVGGLSNRELGETDGEERVTLFEEQIPSHNHSLAVSSSPGTSYSPSDTILAANAEGIKQFASTSNASSASTSIGNTGGSLPHNNMQPYLVVNFIICLDGMYPSAT